MAVRQSVGIALTLAAGVAIGYVVSPSAQVVPILPGPPTPYQQIKLRAVALDQNRVSITVDTGEVRTFVGREIEFSIDRTHVILPPTDGTAFGQVYELPRR
jgi:hypothetical protein